MVTTGRTVSHNRILEKHRGDFICVVYEIEDTKLRCVSALKFRNSSRGGLS
jgi:hypothetical protein